MSAQDSLQNLKLLMAIYLTAGLHASPADRKNSSTPGTPIPDTTIAHGIPAPVTTVSPGTPTPSTPAPPGRTVAPTTARGISSTTQSQEISSTDQGQGATLYIIMAGVVAFLALTILVFLKVRSRKKVAPRDSDRDDRSSHSSS